MDFQKNESMHALLSVAETFCLQTSRYKLVEFFNACVVPSGSSFTADRHFVRALFRPELRKLRVVRSWVIKLGVRYTRYLRQPFTGK